MRIGALRLTFYIALACLGAIASPRAVAAQILINAGGPAFTDSTGRVWAADKNFSGGTTWGKTTAIAGTVDDTLFQTERYGTFSYNIPVPNGTYTITLRFAEFYWTSAGKRVFNVTVEGQPALTNFDIFAAAGPSTAVDRVVTATVTDGMLNIGFVSVVDNAKVSAIQVVASTGVNQPPVVNAGPDQAITLPVNSVGLTATASDDGLPASPGGLTYAWSLVTGPAAATFSAATALSTTVSVPVAGTYKLRLTVSDSVLATTDDVDITVNPPATFAPVRINAGGPAFTDSLGQTWAADKNFSGGTTWSQAVAIAGTVDDPLFQSERYGTFAYNIPVPSGTYTITLRFAEFNFTSAGKRVFNVTVEGQPVLTNFDIFAVAGPSTAVDRVVTSTVIDGTLNINFASVVDNAKVSAIQVVATAATGVNQPPVVNAGPDQAVTLPVNSVALTGTASDDGLPASAGGLRYAWSLVTGPAAPTFTAATALSTSVTFPAAGTYTFRLTASDSALASTDDVVVTVNPPAAFAPVRINAGGPAFMDSAGQTWAADKNFTGGTSWVDTVAIAGTVDDPLFQSERYGTFSYNMAVPNGIYTITLRFAESHWTSAGKRVFNVTVEGQPALTNFDIFAVAGPNAAVDRVVTAIVTDGMLNIGFATVVDNAKVSAIQVVAAPVVTLYRVSGVITPAAAAAGATVSLGGAATATTVTDASGAYSFSGLANGVYAVMASRSGYTFAPSSRTVTVAGADLQGVNFDGSAVPTTYAIRGIVSGGAGSTVTLSGTASSTTTADSSGSFVFNGLSNGAYTVTPSKAGFGYSPAAQTVTVSGADVGSVNFTALAPTMTRANSYDDAWKQAWVSHGRTLLSAPGKTAGFVLEVGDSITHSRAYSAWAIQGQGKTLEDAQVMAWAHASDWSSTNTDSANKNGWYLAGADTTTLRGMTSSSGLSVSEVVQGCCNSGSTMPSVTNPTTARQTISDPTYTGNIQIDTLIASFSDAQFAVLMLGTNDPGNPNGLTDLGTILDKLEAAGILTILSTIPPRNDGLSNQFNVDFNAGIRALAVARSLPLIDFYQEILWRRPGTTWFNTLVSSDGVHPTGDRAGFTVTSDPYLPGGDPATLTTGDAPANVGYLLRSWLTVQKLKEVKRYVVDGIDP